MGGDDKRGFKPDQLERLAGLMADLNTSTDEMFKRASSLQASQFLNSLREMPRWGSDSAKDLTKRAALLRLTTGDPFSGLAWAGFSPLEIAAGGDKLDPTTLIYINTVADWANKTGNVMFGRKPGESLDDYLKRLEAGAITKIIPDLKPHEATVAQVLEIAGDVRGVTTTAPLVTAQATSLSRLLLNNYAWRPITSKLTGGRWALQTRSAVSPGTGIAGLTRQLFMKSSLYRDFAAMLPEYTEMDQVARAANAGRALLGARVNSLLDLAFGSNKLASVLAGTTHSGQVVSVSGQANLLKVWASTANPSKLEAAAQVLRVEPAALARLGTVGRLGMVAKTAGAFRTLGVVGGVASTLYSGANVISQGNPVTAFKRNGAGYVADVAELGFNASLTAAMVCPNPVTIGATVVFGAVYVGAKVVEHWDDVKAGAKKVGDAIGDGAKKVGDGAKKVFKSLNPFG
ncbi:hypothetical protein Psi02_36250 [Planotetraspora silvatica]|uniref:PE-PGRS family protein n=1 Tax=Planotetraspora silvatica TaxID=234614 RepID=A0A8J3UMM2_9ACTN|nr:hypothetical protein [Planotetraspora silvatica]GII47201.1 hypothetical protein Psi02_36250 [Planotetraspora silvatica]